VASASSRCSEDRRQDAEATIEANNLPVPADGDGARIATHDNFLYNPAVTSAPSMM
jgi:hypothetical protein